MSLNTLNKYDVSKKALLRSENYLKNSSDTTSTSQKAKERYFSLYSKPSLQNKEKLGYNL
jgi:hypothetical protein